MDIGIIAPIKFLTKYCTTGIQYCLPELLLESKEYLDFYTEAFHKGDKVILDVRNNDSLRKPLKEKILKDVLEIFEPTLIVMPSNAYSLSKTLVTQEDFIKLDLIKPWLTNNRLIACLEATNEVEVLKYQDIWKGSKLAIPSHMYIVTKKMLKAPRGLFIENRNDPYEIPQGPGALLTSMPVRLGLEGRLNSLGPTTSSTLNFYLEEERFNSVIDKNIEDLISYYKESNERPYNN